MTPRRLFLLDAYALIYRAYYALLGNPRVTTRGLNTSAVFGFVNTLDEVLRKENPTHIAVCFDPSGPTFRHEEYPEYKAQREKQPEDITLSVPYIKRILAAYRIPVVEMPGYEADDVIGTLAHRARSEGYEVYMMTPDKDYGQLVTDGVYMYRPSLRGQGFEIRGPEQICERYGISSPRQMIDLLALEGDASDNIPGCPGVGEKTAVKLISEFGSVENLLASTASLKGALKKKVEENEDKIRLSKHLATIITDVPVDVTIDSLERRDINVDELIDIYRELEFKTFIARLNARLTAESAVQQAETPAADSSGMGSLFDAPVPEPVNAAAVSTATLDTEKDIARAVERACAMSRVGVAVEAAGDDAMTASISGLAIAYGPDEASWIPLSITAANRAEVAEILAPLFTCDFTTLVSHDVKRDMLLLRRMGIVMTAQVFDTSVAHYVIDPEMKHTLQSVASRYLGIELPADAEPSAAAALRAATALRLMDPLASEVENRHMSALMNDVEFPLIGVLAGMEWAGVRIDTSVLDQLAEGLRLRLAQYEQEIYTLAGHSFNIGSPSQVGAVLFEEMKIDEQAGIKAKRTARGSYSTTEQILEQYEATVPIVSLILKYRRLKKLLTTYLEALPAMVNPVTGKIHTSYNQTVTATGRISSTNPNLQNIPIRTDDGREIRRAFIPDEGCLLMSADYSQIELRLIADLSGDADMIEAFHSGADIHRVTASKIYKVPLEEVTDDQRRHAKTANFGIIYGISAFGLSQRLGIPRADARRLIDGYFATYPGIRRYLDEAVATARTDGYVTTRMGRRRYLPDINSRNATVRSYAERNAVNAPIQGTAADIIKAAMITIAARMTAEGMRSTMIMQVHDELIFNVIPDELSRLQEIVRTGMESAYSGAVPLEVSMGVATNWLEAH
ncbi:MAG: DNA polymerase I [Barnesiella sp.]|nr:DNA polymerase I [Barnesiella sp.]MBD5254357.1 DNA polymerase I [Barnesiella sp.]